VPICIVVLKGIKEANELKSKLKNASTELRKFQLIQPSDYKKQSKSSLEQANESNQDPIQSIDIESVKLLNPKLARKIRQKTMAFWLMPFGFITGLAFTKMTNLNTFSNFGLGPIGEALMGSFLGMGSGLLGSYFAARSINPDINNDIETLRKLSNKGLWLLLLETPLEMDLPWELLKESNNEQIVRINEI